jgi:hypothetical protein
MVWPSLFLAITIHHLPRLPLLCNGVLCFVGAGGGGTYLPNLGIPVSREGGEHFILERHFAEANVDIVQKLA